MRKNLREAFRVTLLIRNFNFIIIVLLNFDYFVVVVVVIYLAKLMQLN